jgi:hypothetical protein
MDKQSPLLQEQHDISIRNFMQAGPLDQNQIAWKDRRHHARAKDAKTNLAKCADNFLCQSAGQFDRSIPLNVRSHFQRVTTKPSC